MNSGKNTIITESPMRGRAAGGCIMCGGAIGGNFNPIKAAKNLGNKAKKSVNKIAKDAGGDKVTQFAIKKGIPAVAGAATGAVVGGVTGNPLAGMAAGAAASELSAAQARKLAKKAKGKGVGPKKTSPWIAHVKAYAKEHNIKYGEALKKASATYKK